MNRESIVSTYKRLQVAEALRRGGRGQEVVEPIWSETQDSKTLANLQYTDWISARADWVPRRRIVGLDRHVAVHNRQVRDQVFAECEELKKYYQSVQRDLVEGIMATGLTAMQNPKSPIPRSVEFGSMKGQAVGSSRAPERKEVETQFGTALSSSTHVQSDERRALERTRKEKDEQMKALFEDAQKRREEVTRTIQQDIESRTLSDRNIDSPYARKSKFSDINADYKDTDASDAFPNDRTLNITQRDLPGIHTEKRRNSYLKSSQKFSSASLAASNEYQRYKRAYNTLITEPFVIPSQQSRVLAGRVTANYLRHIDRIKNQLSSISDHNY